MAFETKKELRDALIEAEAKLKGATIINDGLSGQNEKLAKEVDRCTGIIEDNAKRIKKIEGELGKREADIAQRDAFIEYTKQRYNQKISELADSCRVIYETEKKIEDFRLKLEEVEEDSPKFKSGSAILAQAEDDLRRAYSDRRRYEDVASEMLFQITGTKPTLEMLVENIAVEVTAGHKNQNSRGGDYVVKGYSPEECAKRDKTYDSDNGKVVVFHGGKALLLPSVPGILSQIEGKGYLKLRQGTPYSNDEYPVDDFEMQARLRVMAKYNYMVHEYYDVEEARNENGARKENKEQHEA